MNTKLTEKMFDLMDYDGDRTREICVTPYSGNYGKPAGFVIAINGSPPKGVLFVPFNNSDEPILRYKYGKIKSIPYEPFNGWNTEISSTYQSVLAFLKERGFVSESGFPLFQPEMVDV